MRKLFLAALILFLLVGCAGEPIHKSGSLRIVSLAPSITEILFELDLEDEIVGITTYCDFPSQTTSLEKVGTFSEPNIEKIIALRPHLVLATGGEQWPSVEKLKRLKVEVKVFYPSNMDELFRSIEEIGKLTARRSQAHRLIAGMKRRIDKIREKTEDILQAKRPKVFIEIWDDPMMTAGRGSFVDELITIAGGVNIASDTPRPYCRFSPELVIKRNPDCIILAYMGKGGQRRKLADRIGWGQISAVKEGRIYDDIDPDLFLRPGPRLIKGLEEIHKRLYANREALPPK